MKERKPTKEEKALLDEIKRLKYVVKLQNETREKNEKYFTELEIEHESKLKEYQKIVLDKNQEIEKLQKSIKSRTEQVLDINQWASLMINNRPTIRPRIMWSMIADIMNRTTD